MTAGSSTVIAAAVQVNEFDVLTGRDRLAFGHPGNRYFRQLCALSRGAYQTAHKRSAKTDIIQSIIARVKERDGRFLTLQDEGLVSSIGHNRNRHGNGPIGGGITWIEMNASATHQKVSHSLRSGKTRASFDESSSSLSASASSSSLSSPLSPSPGPVAPPLQPEGGAAVASSAPALVPSQRSGAGKRRERSLWDMHDFLFQQSDSNVGAAGHESILQDLDTPFADVRIFDFEATPKEEEEAEEKVEGCESYFSDEEGSLVKEDEERPGRRSRHGLCLFDAMILDSFATPLPEMPKQAESRFSFYGSDDLEDLLTV